MEPIFLHLAIILLTAFIVSYIIKALKQPVIIGYIITGMIISPFILNFGASEEIINIFSHLGIAFLLFIVGLHLNPRVIKEVGFPSLIIGIVQMALTFVVGFFAGVFLGFNNLSSIYIGIALMFSSTIIVMKLLSDKKHLDTLYGKISIGILIIQDLVAVLVLMIISSTTNFNMTSITSFAFKNLITGAIVLFFLFVIGFFAIPKITRAVAKSQELLFLFSIAWCFLIAALFGYLGFSIEIGALVAGVVLSVSPYSIEISSKIRPLRDFFLIIFFIILGLNIELNNINSIIINSLILSFAVLLLKPIIFMTLMALFKHAKRNNFFVGITLAQISEFSLIIVALGVSLGHITPELLSTLTLTGLITITLSTYMAIYSNEFYIKMSRFISIFERKDVRDKKEIRKKYSAILIGYNRIGFSILRALKNIRKDYLVIDYNPDIVSDLKKLRIPVIYGDAYDVDFLNELPLEKTELVVSTIPDFEINCMLIEKIRKINEKAIIIVRAHQINDALELYKKGANYVLTPHFLGGEYISKMILNLKTDDKKYEEEKKIHIKMLKERLEKGQEHPEVERD
ncbi:MAG: cation:proton antiporter [Candidatus Pacearchaeota archaeon]